MTAYVQACVRAGARGMRHEKGGSTMLSIAIVEDEAGQREQLAASVQGELALRGEFAV